MIGSVPTLRYGVVIRIDRYSVYVEEGFFVPVSVYVGEGLKLCPEQVARLGQSNSGSLFERYEHNTINFAKLFFATAIEEVFDSLNVRFFGGLLGRPDLTWSEHHAKRLLGHYDAAHNTIVVSRVFDRPDTPRCAIEYLLYHEMLHLKHPVRVKAGRRCVHSREFQAEERLFPELVAARAYLKQL